MNDATPIPAVSVIIPARNEEATIRGCLDALAAQTIGATNIEVIVASSGSDGTAQLAQAAHAPFNRLVVVHPVQGNKNAALRLGCARARGSLFVLLDADTQLAPTALAVLQTAIERRPRTVVSPALRAQVRTWVARYLELQHRLVKEVHFDDTLTGCVIAGPRAAFPLSELAALLPDRIGATDDAYLSRQLRARGWQLGYVREARAATLFAWTVRGLVRAALRNRRGTMAALPLGRAVLEAGKSVLLVASLPATLVLAPWHPLLAVLCLVPLAWHGCAITWHVSRLRGLSGRDWRAQIPAYLLLDVIARGLKVWAFVERVAKRQPPLTFRGERPDVGVPPQRVEA